MSHSGTNAKTQYNGTLRQIAHTSPTSLGGYIDEFTYVLRELKSGSAQTSFRRRRQRVSDCLRIMEKVAERVGFEPTGPFGPPVFKTGAIDHSAISPYAPTVAGVCKFRKRAIKNLAATHYVD